MRYINFILCGMIITMSGCQSTPKQTGPQPPVAKRQAKELTTHGHTRVDDYYWLNQREDPEVISYLEAENAYTEQMTSHLTGFEQTLFEEIKGRIKQDDSTPPTRIRDYLYYTRYEDGQQYPIYCRKQGSNEQVLLNVNELAKGHEFTQVGNWDIDTTQNILAYAIDHQGRRLYTIHFKDLATGQLLPDTIENVTANMQWAEDGQTLVYARQDRQTLRFNKIYRHTLGSPAADDALVYHETDEEFSCYVTKSKSRQYLMIASQQSLSSEFRFVDAKTPAASYTVVSSREPNHEYSVTHFGEHFYIMTNSDGAKNFKLMRTPVDQTERRYWEEVIPHRSDVLLEDLDVFGQHMVLTERKDGLKRMRIRKWDGQDDHYLDFGEPAYQAYTTGNYELDSGVLRYGYTSLTTPRSWIDYDMATRNKTVVKQTPILGGFNSQDYKSERIWAEARDGVKVPVSLVYHKDKAKPGKSPLLLYGYGSYGASMDAGFNSTRLTLLDRGFVYAIAHIRGGQELGRSWYDDGKMLKKMNTFTDFIDCAKYLVKTKHANKNKIYAMGGSAGGLLMGAIINLEPKLFNGVVAHVPFVDVVTTMLDDSIPLTTSEYDEWGNPNEKPYYDYMLSYSPYDNVERQEYPHLLVTTGLHDSQVQYWEPAKWVAKLRAVKKGDNSLLLKTNMDAGHGGASGRYKRYKELAFQYAWLLDLERLAG